MNLNELVRKNIHHHTRPESRLFLVGSGKYHFQIDSDTTIELSVKAGTFIIIPANLKHYFNTDEQTIFLRFFSDNNTTELDELTGEIK
jgi:cupin superfamily acireductone dioxygenase involved in methionine salvage